MGLQRYLVMWQELTDWFGCDHFSVSNPRNVDHSLLFHVSMSAFPVLTCPTMSVESFKTVVSMLIVELWFLQGNMLLFSVFLNSWLSFLGIVKNKCPETCGKEFLYGNPNSYSSLPISRPMFLFSLITFRIVFWKYKSDRVFPQVEMSLMAFSLLLGKNPNP